MILKKCFRLHRQELQKFNLLGKSFWVQLPLLRQNCKSHYLLSFIKDECSVPHHYIITYIYVNTSFYAYLSITLI